MASIHFMTPDYLSRHCLVSKRVLKLVRVDNYEKSSNRET